MLYEVITAAGDTHEIIDLIVLNTCLITRPALLPTLPLHYFNMKLSASSKISKPLYWWGFGGYRIRLERFLAALNIGNLYYD